MAYAMAMNRSTLLAFLIASVAGFAIWALSPWLTGYNEPWDAPGVYYYVALLLAGAVSGFITAKPPHRQVWAQYAGGVFGQLLYGLVFLPMGPLAAVGLISLGLWSLLFLAGAYLGSLLRSYMPK